MAEQHQLLGVREHEHNASTQPESQRNSPKYAQQTEPIPIEYFSCRSMQELSAADRDNKEVYTVDEDSWNFKKEAVVLDNTGLIPLESSDLVVVPDDGDGLIPVKPSDLIVVPDDGVGLMTVNPSDLEVNHEKSGWTGGGWSQVSTTTFSTDDNSKTPTKPRRRFPFNLQRRTIVILIVTSIFLIIGAAVTVGVIVSQHQKGINATDNTEPPEGGSTNASTIPITRRFGTAMHSVDLNDDGKVTNFVYFFQFDKGASKTVQFSWAKVNEEQVVLENPSANIGYQGFNFVTIPNSPIKVVGQPMEDGAKDLIVDIFYLHQPERPNSFVDVAQIRIFCAPLEPCRWGFNNLLYLSNLGESLRIDPENPSMTASLINSESGVGVRKSLWLYYRTVKNEMVGHIVKSSKSGDKFDDPNLKLFFTQALPQEELKETFNSTPAAFVGLQPSQGHFLFFGSRSGIYLVWWNETSHFINFGTFPASGFKDNLSSRPELYTLTACSDQRSEAFFLIYADVFTGQVSGFSGLSPLKHLGLDGNLSVNQNRKTQWDATGSWIPMDLSKPLDPGEESLSIACYDSGRAVLVYQNEGALVYALNSGIAWSEAKKLGLDLRG
ncbi:hypothetical protein QBC38DRAFT_485352 [Podospora fimiseda]|uniref:Fucose-specific lectin n=1 Tax=Podospora fimiseda TaxID=252190 RepID=A0AAN7BJM3_9PEZI|nr:hypothetical protein QBC38DRAFT_485352 [Podospora fimiseda]